MRPSSIQHITAKKAFCSLLASATILALAGASTVAIPAHGQVSWGNGSESNSPISDQLRSMEKQTASIAKNVQFFLQANNRWFPAP